MYSEDDYVPFFWIDHRGCICQGSPDTEVRGHLPFAHRREYKLLFNCYSGILGQGPGRQEADPAAMALNATFQNISWLEQVREDSHFRYW